MGGGIWITSRIIFDILSIFFNYYLLPDASNLSFAFGGCNKFHSFAYSKHNSISILYIGDHNMIVNLYKYMKMWELLELLESYLINSCCLDVQILEKTDYTLISGNPFIKKSGKYSLPYLKKWKLFN